MQLSKYDIPTRTTPIRIIEQGTVQIDGVDGYDVRGNHAAVCFYVDLKNNGFVIATGHRMSEPTIHLWANEEDEEEETVISFPEFFGWRVHSVRGGEGLSVALTNDFVDLA